MPFFTVEFSYLVPAIVRKTFKAEDAAHALTIADKVMELDQIDWSLASDAGDGGTTTQVTGLWQGGVAYTGDDVRPAEYALKVDQEIAREVAPMAGGELLQAAKLAAVVMAKNIYPKPDVPPNHPYAILCRLQAAVAAAEA